VSPSSIIVHLTAGTSNDAVLQVAANLARRVRATRAIGISAYQPLQIYGSPDAYIPSELATWDLEHIEKQLSAAEGAFRAALEGKVTSCQWRSTTITYGTIADYVAEQMRAADLLVTAADKDASMFDKNHVTLADLVIRAGKPVLVVGSGVVKLDLRSVLIGWKDTREARRATQDALPLLKLSDQVTVLEVAAKNDLDHARKRTEDVATWLAEHGITAVARTDAAIGHDSTVIENIAKEIDAGLLVGGAYGHNRLREWVLGGVTRDLLMHPARCSFMSH
jgi:nucleotide-binding universal stress UspA family protein